MNRSGGEAFARLAQQLNRARLQASGGGGRGSGGGGMPGGAKGFMAGGGLLAVLAGGGLILNYSLFNGTYLLDFVCDIDLTQTFSRWWSSSDQIFEITWCPIRHLPRRNSSCGMSIHILKSGSNLPCYFADRIATMARNSNHLRCPS
jgi:hypothetical protein